MTSVRAETCNRKLVVGDFSRSETQAAQTPTLKFFSYKMKIVSKREFQEG